MSIANQLQEDELFLVDYMNIEKAANCMQLNEVPNHQFRKKILYFLFLSTDKRKPVPPPTATIALKYDGMSKSAFYRKKN